MCARILIRHLFGRQHVYDRMFYVCRKQSPCATDESPALVSFYHLAARKLVIIVWYALAYRYISDRHSHLIVNIAGDGELNTIDVRRQFRCRCQKWQDKFHAPMDVHVCERAAELRPRCGQIARAAGNPKCAIVAESSCVWRVNCKSNNDVDQFLRDVHICALHFVTAPENQFFIRPRGSDIACQSPDHARAITRSR